MTEAQRVDDAPNRLFMPFASECKFGVAGGSIRAQTEGLNYIINSVVPHTTDVDAKKFRGILRLIEKPLAGFFANMQICVLSCITASKRLLPKIKAKRVFPANVTPGLGYTCHYCTEQRVLLFTEHPVYDQCGGCRR